MKRVGHSGSVIQVAVFLLVILIIPITVISACGPEPPSSKEGEMAITLTSVAFKEGGKIPVKYTCDGQDISPALEWGELPTGTKTFALIVDDPDAPAGIFTHWVIFNIPAASRKLPEAVPATAQLNDGTLQGKNDMGKLGYGGPCPPPGRAHRYQFTIYALDKSLDLKSGASKKELLSAMKGHILAQGQLTGLYQR